MAKLQCNVCGGSLVMRSDGNAVCENCGMIYKPEEVKRMAAEITGTVKVDGEVKVAGISDIEKLSNNGEIYIKLGEVGKAKDCYQKIIDRYPEDYRGWWGMLLIETNSLRAKNPKIVMSNYEKALKTADSNERQIIERQFSEYKRRWDEKLKVFRSGKFIEQKSVKSIAYINPGLNSGTIATQYFGGGGQPAASCYSEFNAFRLFSDGRCFWWCDVSSRKNGEWYGGSRNYEATIQDDGTVTMVTLDKYQGKEYTSTKTTTIVDISDDFAVLTLFEESGIYHLKGPVEFRTDFRNVEGEPIPSNDLRNSGGFCFIATAVYGSYDSPEVLTLRRFRDEVLLKSLLGHKFVAFYYKHGQRYAEKLKTHRCVNRAVKFFLDGFVEVIEKTNSRNNKER